MLNFFKTLLVSITHAANGNGGDRSSLMDWFRGQVCKEIEECKGIENSKNYITCCLANLNLNSIVVLLNLVIRFVLAFAGIIAVIFLIYTGYLFMVSLGNPDKLAEAKLKLVWTIVGLILIITAYLIVYFLFGAFGPPDVDYNPFI